MITTKLSCKICWDIHPCIEKILIFSFFVLKNPYPGFSIIGRYRQKQPPISPLTVNYFVSYLMNILVNCLGDRRTYFDHSDISSKRYPPSLLLFYIKCLVSHNSTMPATLKDSGGGNEPYNVKDSQEINVSKRGCTKKTQMSQQFCNIVYKYM